MESGLMGKERRTRKLGRQVLVIVWSDDGRCNPCVAIVERKNLRNEAPMGSFRGARPVTLVDRPWRAIRTAPSSSVFLPSGPRGALWVSRARAMEMQIGHAEGHTQQPSELHPDTRCHTPSGQTRIPFQPPLHSSSPRQRHAPIRPAPRLPHPR